MTSNYYVIVQGGNVFEGSLNEFKSKYYSLPQEWDEEQIIEYAKAWAESNNWTIEFGLCH